jgi:molecular chaperone HtpG
MFIRINKNLKKERAMTEQNTAETYRFQTEDDRLLDIVINSLYSDKEIFLRELISNGADAIGKAKYLSLSDEAYSTKNGDYRITIKLDPTNKSLLITDNGVGMTKQEIIDHLGTIARSGTHEFLKNLEQPQTQELIGQFGVGFYSVFMVADHVDVISKSAHEEQAWKFSSTGKGSFSLEPVEKTERGTTIIAHMKDDEYLHLHRIKHVVEKYSNYAPVPIYLEHEIKNEENDDKTWTTERLNETQPLWLTSKNNISEEQYKEFYREIGKDFRDPLSWLHGKIEGTTQYTYLLYIPSELPFYFSYQETPKGVKLHVKHILITDDSTLLLPRYLSFISGVVDFQDLPLNVSRELLQEHKSIERAKTAITKKILSHLQTMATDQPTEYGKFWKNFGQMFKMFPADDHQHKDIILPLLRFNSTQSQQELIGLDDYIARMPAEQKAIYYVTASTLDAAINSPHMDYFKKHNIEVLLLLDRVDESLMNYLSSYKEKDFQSITRAELKDIAPEADQTDKEDTQNDLSATCAQLKESLTGKVKDVRVSSRLVDAPCCLVVDQSFTLHMQRLLKEAGQSLPETLPILEINKNHAIVKQIQALEGKNISRWATFLFSLALLAEGGQLNDPASFSKEISVLLNQVHLNEL